MTVDTSSRALAAVASLALIVVLVSIAACDNQKLESSIELRGKTMATGFSITLVRPPTSVNKSELQYDIETTLANIERMASTYNPDSEISRFNQEQSKQWQTVSAEFCAMISAARAMSQSTNGHFDLTIGRAVDAWGFGASQSAITIPDMKDTQEIRETIGYDNLEIDCDRPGLRKSVRNLALDLSAWAKGHAVDQVAELVASYGIKNYLVEIGGEIRAVGNNSNGDCFNIGIESPQPKHRSIDVSVRLCDAAVATSGNYRNFFVADGISFSHTIDPRTARPVDHNLAAVTVVDSSAASADALATALLVLGPIDGPSYAAQRQIAALFIIKDEHGYRVATSPNFETLRRQ